MKYLIFVTVLVTMFASCNTKDRYHKFLSEESDFVVYNEGQTIKFIDTNLVSRTLIQSSYKREFVEHVGMFSAGRTFYEIYQTSYLTQTGTPPIDLSVYVAHVSSIVDIQFSGYRRYTGSIFLSPSTTPVLINGVSYNNVYTLKMYNTKAPGATETGELIASNNQSFPNNDTATLYHNKQYGVIQLLFPNGKRILRSN